MGDLSPAHRYRYTFSSPAARRLYDAGVRYQKSRMVPMTEPQVLEMEPKAITPAARTLISSALRDAAYAFGTSVEELKGPRLNINIIHARRIAAKRIREGTDLSPRAIGLILGGRDRTTIINLLETYALAEAAMAKKSRHDDKAVTDILAEAADMSGTDIASIRGRGRTRLLSPVRQHVIRRLRDELDMSFPAIGMVLGRRDHTTVMHLYKKAKESAMRST